MISFAEYLYEQKLDPSTIAFKSNDELMELKSKWKKTYKIRDEITKKDSVDIFTDKSFNQLDKVYEDIVYSKLSSLNLKIDNNKLVKVVSKMTKGDEQTNLVGTWIYYCIKSDKAKAEKAKAKVSEKYQTTIEKYIDSFIKMLG